MIVIKGKKQPYDRKDYDVGGSDWLTDGDAFASATVASVECLTTPADAALVVDLPIVSSPWIKIWTDAGTNAQKYKITVRAVTTAGRKIEFEIVITVKDE